MELFDTKFKEKRRDFIFPKILQYQWVNSTKLLVVMTPDEISESGDALIFAQVRAQHVFVFAVANSFCLAVF